MRADRNIYGQAFDAPLAQAIVPVIRIENSTAVVLGYLNQSGVFTGEETELEVQGVKLPATSVIVPAGLTRAATQEDEFTRTPYFAVVAQDETYPSIPNFVSAADAYQLVISRNGFSLPKAKAHQGKLLGNMRTNMSSVGGDVPKAPDALNLVTPQSLTWAAEVRFDDGPAYLDFNWLELFKAELGIPSGEPFYPTKLDIVSNPATGELKAMLVQQQDYEYQGQPLLDAVRIVLLKKGATGEFTFEFKATQANEQGYVTTDVTLKLTLV